MPTQVGWIRYRLPSYPGEQTLFTRATYPLMVSDVSVSGVDLMGRAFLLPREFVVAMGHLDVWREPSSSVSAVDIATPAPTPPSVHGDTSSRGILDRFWDSLIAACAWVGISRKAVGKP